MSTLSRYSGVADAMLLAGKAARFAQRGYHPHSRHFSAGEVMRQPRPVIARLTRGRPGKDPAARPA